MMLNYLAKPILFQINGASIIYSAEKTDSTKVRTGMARKASSHSFNKSLWFYFIYCTMKVIKAEMLRLQKNTTQNGKLMCCL